MNASVEDQRTTIIAWSGDLDRVWPQLILATTAAAYGMTTTVFFTFWGLFTLKRPEVKITGSDWKTKGLGVMNRQGLTKLNMAGLGPLLMKKVAEEHKVAPPAELLALAQELGVRLWPCSMTMDLMGLRPADLIDGVGEPVGAATALAEMQRSAVNLFI
ncbi:MAG: DsrE/DsrF/DrsH-like family protein [Acidimicrobiia bacterium]|nr:DsrE/DsrF/DrsH-like family protein [Acidimicrobiia bacterium]